MEITIMTAAAKVVAFQQRGITPRNGWQDLSAEGLPLFKSVVVLSDHRVIGPDFWVYVLFARVQLFADQAI
jgi:hypothetical protein